MWFCSSELELSLTNPSGVGNFLQRTSSYIYSASKKWLTGPIVPWGLSFGGWRVCSRDRSTLYSSSLCRYRPCI